MAEIETQKGVVEVEIVEDGEVRELCVPAGTKVPVGEVLARVGNGKLPTQAAAAPPAAPVPSLAAPSAPVAPPPPEMAERVHLGVAISLREGGLVLPAHHDADTLDVPTLDARLLRSSAWTCPSPTTSSWRRSAGAWRTSRGERPAPLPEPRRRTSLQAATRAPRRADKFRTTRGLPIASGPLCRFCRCPS